MTFKEALEREIATQALAIADIAEISGVSKGAIYNILNGKTEDERIRPATRKAIAKGCHTELQTMDDGGVQFVDPGEHVPRQVAPDVVLSILPARPFLEDRFFREPFDWLHNLEESRVIGGLNAVDRVYQRREDFLGLVLDNRGSVQVAEVRFDLKVTYDARQAAAQFALKWPALLGPGQRSERTLFLGAGSGYDLEIINPSCEDESGVSRRLDGPAAYAHKG